MSSAGSTTSFAPRADILLRCTQDDQRWGEEHGTIDLDSTYEFLLQQIDAAATAIRRRKDTQLLELKSNDLGVTMRATQTFGANDLRTLYVDGFPRRFAKIRDMFTSKQIADAAKNNHNMVVTLDMKIELIELSRVTPNKPKPAWLYHRIGTVPISGERCTPGGTYAILHRIDADQQQLSSQLVRVSERQHNGLPIGDVSRPLRIDGLTLDEAQQAEPYRGLDEDERERLLDRTLARIAHTRNQEYGIPQLPHMTYSTFQPTPAAKAISNEDPITLDVRLYNRLSSIGGGEAALPWAITMEAYAGKGAKSTIVEDIGQTIYKEVDALDEAKEPNDSSRTALLFGPDLEGKWAIELWIMPQSGQMEKSYQYREESLVWFLDPDFAQQGKRLLYMEAHLVPR